MYLKNGRTCCGMKSQKNNMWMKILSVVIAVLIWLFVANTNDPVITKRFYSIPVKVTNEDALTKRGYAYEILDGEEVNITKIIIRLNPTANIKMPIFVVSPTDIFGTSSSTTT